MPVYNPARDLVWNPATGQWEPKHPDQYPASPYVPLPQAPAGGAAQQPASATPPPSGGGATVPPPGTPPPATPPVAPPATQQPAAGPGYVPEPAAPPDSILSGLDFEEELRKLLATDPRAEKLEGQQYEAIQRDLNAPDFGPEDQKILDLARQSAHAAAAVRTRGAEKALSGMGLRESDELVKAHQRETDNLTQQLIENEVNVRTAALNRGRATRAEAQVRASAFAKAIQDKNAALAQALLQAHSSEVEAGLQREQLDLQRMEIEENVLLNRDRFTEEQRARMKAEGFTESQIDNAERQAQWERVFRQNQQSADINLAQQNYDLQKQALTLEERRVAVTEIRNNADITLQDRVFQLQKQFGIDDRNFDREKFQAMTAQLEREFGLTMNQFALEQSIRTGQLELDILNSQRRYDLDVEGQRQQWLATEAARETQEKLGMADIELRMALGMEQNEINRLLGMSDIDLRRELGLAQVGVQMSDIEMRQLLGQGQLDVAREQQIIEKYMFDAGLQWDKDKLAIQIREARKANRGSFLGKLVKGIVGAGAGIIGLATGNPMLIAAGINTIAGQVVATPPASAGSSQTQ